MEQPWDASPGITGSVPRLGAGQAAGLRVALRTNAPRKTTETGAGEERDPGAETGAGPAPETENEPGAPGAETGGGPEAETEGGQAAAVEPGGPDLAAPARAGKRMRRRGAKRKTPSILYLTRKRLKRRKKMRRLRINKTLTRTSWRKR